MPTAFAGAGASLLAMTPFPVAAHRSRTRREETTRRATRQGISSRNSATTDRPRRSPKTCCWIPARAGRPLARQPPQAKLWFTPVAARRPLPAAYPWARSRVVHRAGGADRYAGGSAALRPDSPPTALGSLERPIHHRRFIPAWAGGSLCRSPRLAFSAPSLGSTLAEPAVPLPLLPLATVCPPLPRGSTLFGASASDALTSTDPSVSGLRPGPRRPHDTWNTGAIPSHKNFP